MKKILILTMAIFVSAVSTQAFANENVTQLNPATKFVQQQNKQAFEQKRAQKEAEFEKKLGLTDEQKVQIKEFRKKSFEKIKPVMEQMKVKKQEIDTIKASKLSAEEIEQKIAPIEVELKDLHKQAMKIRQENMKEFESILTTEQQNILKQMKKEGRKNFHKKFKKNKRCRK